MSSSGVFFPVSFQGTGSKFLKYRCCCVDLHAVQSDPSQIISSMNAFIVGSPVYFYDSTGQVVRGVVEHTNRLADGTQMVAIRCDNGRIVTLPTWPIHLKHPEEGKPVTSRPADMKTLSRKMRRAFEKERKISNQQDLASSEITTSQQESDLVFADASPAAEFSVASLKHRLADKTERDQLSQSIQLSIRSIGVPCFIIIMLVGTSPALASRNTQTSILEVHSDLAIPEGDPNAAAIEQRDVKAPGYQAKEIKMDIEHATNSRLYDQERSPHVGLKEQIRVLAFALSTDEPVLIRHLEERSTIVRLSGADARGFRAGMESSLTESFFRSISSSTQRSRPPPKFWPVYPLDVHLENLSRVIKYLSSDQRKTYREERKAFIVEIAEHVQIGEAWQKQRTRNREGELEQLRVDRAKAISKKLVDLGYEQDLESIRFPDSFHQHHLVRQPRALTEKVGQHQSRYD
ncbi:uncharacterized protein ARMOST_22658 [Armillaria ostoyae]|uniref:Uncharacterized protein n=1 Tax=Armillaria ostoyae TaxID=47428 RepID=A0A284SDH3_ARMOS|nr:uncharacterized protein ARMOST_22658 [Armillaria ostoyae]